MSLQRRAAVGFAWMLGGTGTQALLRLVLLIVLARLIGPEAFGVASAAIVVAQFGLIFADFGGIGSALVQKLRLEDRHVRAATALAAGTGAVLTLSLVVSAPLVEQFFGFDGLTELMMVSALTPLLANAGAVSDGLLRRTLGFRMIAIIIVVSYGVAYGVVGIGLAFAGGGAWALVGAFVAERGVRSILSILARPPRRLFGTLDRSTMLEIMTFGGGMILRRSGHQMAEGLDNVIVGRLLGAEALGLYGRAYQLISAVPATIGRALNTVAFPVMAQIQDDPHKLRSSYMRALVAILLAGTPVAALVAAFAPQIVLVVLGREWITAAEPLRILAPGIVLRLMLQLSDALGTAVGHVYEVAWRQWAYAGAVLVGAVLGARWGITGVAWGVLAAQLFAVLLSVHLCLRLTGIPWWRAA